MDLTRIEAWTRQMLESEANKRGIRDPERRSRTELVALIVRHDYAAVRSAGDARRLVGSLVGSAVGALPRPWDALSRLGARLALPGRPKQPPWAAAPAHSPARAVQQAQPVPSAAVAHRVFDKPPTPEGATPAARSSRPPPSAASAPLTAKAATPAVSSAVQAMAAAQPRASSAPPPSTGDSAVTRTFVEEPIRTHSMARLLAGQGHRERALAIYEELITKNSSDNTLLQEAEALRQNTAPGFPAGELPKPSSVLHDELPASADHIECVKHEAGTLRLRWSISREGQARARALLGSPGELTVRVVSIRPDQERVVRSEITEHGPIAPDGEWTATLADQGSRCFAAVGLRDAQRFVSIVHIRT
ncbi:MAG TPA: hypothetical protein VF331_00275 [Polyangiales bacterium]